MESLYNIPFLFLEPPNLKLKQPSWLHQPSSKTVFMLVLLSYFLVTGGLIWFLSPGPLIHYNLFVGIIYDVIVEPPSIGSTTDEHGNSRPVAFMAYRVNGQYIMEGLASSFLFTIGGIGFIIMDQTHAASKLNRLLLTSMGFLLIIVSFLTTWIFMRMKLPGYLKQ